MPTATFFLSTGRCATQWLTAAIRSHCGERTRVEHEPLHNRYHSARMLGLDDPGQLEESRRRPILNHLANIEATLQDRDYVETGHPCWSTLPYLARRWAGRIRIVHLVRHPVPTAFSWLSHGAYWPPLLPAQRPKELIAPSAAGIAFPEYRERWPEMGPFERCLYYWAEVNALGLKLECEQAAPWLRIGYEDLFGPSGAALERLFRFLGSAEAAGPSWPRERPVDRFRFGLPGWPGPEIIGRHPAILGVAARLGYDAQAYDSAALAERFLPSGR